MNFIKRITFLLLLAGSFILTPMVTIAQPTDPCTDPADPCPIDSNLVILISGALIIAAKKAYDYKKAQMAVD